MVNVKGKKWTSCVNRKVVSTEIKTVNSDLLEIKKKTP